MYVHKQITLLYTICKDMNRSKDADTCMHTQAHLNLFETGVLVAAGHLLRCCTTSQNFHSHHLDHFIS